MAQIAPPPAPRFTSTPTRIRAVTRRVRGSMRSTWPSFVALTQTEPNATCELRPRPSASATFRRTRRPVPGAACSGPRPAGAAASRTTTSARAVAAAAAAASAPGRSRGRTRVAAGAKRPRCSSRSAAARSSRRSRVVKSSPVIPGLPSAGAPPAARPRASRQALAARVDAREVAVGRLDARHAEPALGAALDGAAALGLDELLERDPVQPRAGGALLGPVAAAGRERGRERLGRQVGRLAPHTGPCGRRSRAASSTCRR